MKILPSLLFLLILLSGCISTWTARELSDWHTECRKSPFCSPLYYRGTDEKYHYFMCHVMDDYAFMKIKRDEIEVADIQQKAIFSHFPGYYIVDPANGYKQVDKK